MSRTYGRMTCLVCKRSISAAGGGVHHMRAHAKAGDEKAAMWLREREAVRLAVVRLTVERMRG